MMDLILGLKYMRLVLVMKYDRRLPIFLHYTFILYTHNSYLIIHVKTQLVYASINLHQVRYACAMLENGGQEQYKGNTFKMSQIQQPLGQAVARLQNLSDEGDVAKGT